LAPLVRGEEFFPGALRVMGAGDAFANLNVVDRAESGVISNGGADEGKTSSTT